MLGLDMLVESHLLLETASALSALEFLLLILFVIGLWLLILRLRWVGIFLSGQHDLLLMFFALLVISQLFHTLVYCHADLALVDIDWAIFSINLLLIIGLNLLILPVLLLLTLILLFLDLSLRLLLRLVRVLVLAFVGLFLLRVFSSLRPIVSFRLWLQLLSWRC